MLSIVSSSRFKKDYKRMQKRGKDIKKLQEIILILLDEKPLPVKFMDHALKHNLEGYRDCHIEPDWVLVYAVKDGELWLSRTGTHADVFS